MHRYAVVLQSDKEQYRFETRIYKADNIDEAVWLADESPIGNYVLNAYQVADNAEPVWNS